MRVLHTAHTYWPLVDGVSIAMERISEGLAKRGHAVTVATGPAPDGSAKDHGGVAIRRFGVTGNEVLGYTGETDCYVDFIQTFECDVMLNYAAQICTTDLVFPLLPQLECRKVFVPCGYSALRDPRYADYFSRMPERLVMYDRVVYLSGCYQDKAFGDRHRLTNSVIIGNGADETEFAEPTSGFREKYGITERRLFICVANLMPLKGQKLVYDAFAASGITDAALVFFGAAINRYVTGAMRTRPGAMERTRRRANMLRHELFEGPVLRRGTRMRLDSPRGTRVEVLAGVPRALVVAAYHEADLFLFGSQVECAPLVILEAMASRTPWISTPVGNISELPGGIVVKTAQQMAEQIVHLSADDGERRRLAEEGHAAWLAGYTWDRVVDRYDDLYRGLVG